MKKVFVLFSLLLSLGLFCACGGEEEIVKEEIPQNPEKKDNSGENNSPDQPNADKGDSAVVFMLPKTSFLTLTPSQRVYVSKSNDFAFDFYRHVAKYEPLKGKSNITSPLSLGIVLGMLNDGAQGQTEKEISTLLGFDGGQKTEANTFFKTLIEGLPQVDGSVTLQIANMIAYDQKVVFEELYRNDMLGFYHAETPQLDFGDKKATVDYINGWCNKATNGMIPTIIKEENISESTLMALLNAIYFQATWAEKFDPKDTHDEKFTGEGGTVTTLPMMHRKAEILYASNDVYSMVYLPYGGGDKWSMKVLLPNEGKTVDDIISRLTSGTWYSDCLQLKSYIVDLKLPRFETESEIELNGILKEMGVKTMFSEQEADFSPLTKNYKKSDGKSLWVSLIKQKAATKVNEEGTELAAVTIATAEVTAMPREPQLADFHANRPFVYIVQEASSDVVLFIGTMR